MIFDKNLHYHQEQEKNFNRRTVQEKKKQLMIKWKYKMITA